MVVNVRKLADLTGRRFERLVAVRRDGANGHQPVWLCICDCGKEKRVQGNHLKSGATQSCGCLRANREYRNRTGVENPTWLGGSWNRGSLAWAKAVLHSSKKSAIRYGNVKCTDSPQDVQRQWEIQAGKCLISGRAFSHDNPPHLDHDHYTGALRGFVCGNLNVALGMFENSPYLLEQAAQYLRKRRGIEGWLFIAA